MIASVGLSALMAMAASVPLQVGPVTLDMDPPAGFCAPTTPEAKANAQLTAAMDIDNVTLATLIPCGAAKMDGADYFLVKSPTATLASTTEREALLAELEKVMALPKFTDPDPATTNDKIAQNMEKVVGTRPDLQGTVKPLGRDKVCVYMGGIMSLKSAAVSYSRAISTCLTAVGGKVVMVYRYSDDADAENVSKHLSSVRTLALAIRPRSARAGLNFSAAAPRRPAGTRDCWPRCRTRRSCGSVPPARGRYPVR